MTINTMRSWDLMEGFGRYQRAAARTMPQLPKRDTLNMLALGLAGESGEVVDAIKKHLYHGHELPKSKVVDELGDVAWYLVNLCTLFDIELSQVIEFNIAKLLDRYPDGFEAERSINRVDLREQDGQVGGVRMGPGLQKIRETINGVGRWRYYNGSHEIEREEWEGLQGVRIAPTMQEAEDALRRAAGRIGSGVRLYPGTTVDDLIESEHPQTYGTDTL